MSTDRLWLLVATTSEGTHLLVTRAGTLHGTGAAADARSRADKHPPAHKDGSSSLFAAWPVACSSNYPREPKPLILKCQVEEIKISTEHAADPSSEMGSWYCNVNLFAPAVDSTDTCGKKISLASLQRSRAEINGNCEGCLPLHAMHALKLWPPATLKLNIVVLSSFRPLISNVKREKKLVLGLEERLKYSGQHML